MKQLISACRKWLDGLHIRSRLLLCFSLLIILPTLLIAFGSFRLSSAIIERKTRDYSHDVLSQAGQNMQLRMDKLEDISFNIFIQSDLQEILQQAATGQLDAYRASLYTRTVENLLATMVLYHDEVDSVAVVSYGGYAYTLDKRKQRHSLSEEQQALMNDGAGAAVWIGGLENPGVVALARQIYSVKTQRPLGYLVMYIDTGYLGETLRDITSVMGGTVLLTDGNGVAVASPTDDALGQPADAWNAEDAANAFVTRAINGELCYVARSAPMSNGWHILSSAPVTVYQREIARLRLLILAIAAGTLALSVLVAWGLSHKIALPLRRLSDTMTRFGKGELRARYAYASGDEIGQCAQAFNQMGDNIDQLIHQVYEEQLMKRDAELKSLQMQINPHFLYNTLETINWMARTRGNEDIGVIAKALGDLMRATINGADRIPLREEIASLKNYLMIQGFRYGDKVSSQLEIGADTEALYVPKLMIQPLVENAIYHGIEPAFESGCVWIRSWREENKLIIEVRDNGVGMAQEDADALLKGQASEERRSVGVQNVQKRIQTLYGENYGLKIHSDYGDGTTVLITLPADETTGGEEHEQVDC